jgi:hypothetical protein
MGVKAKQKKKPTSRALAKKTQAQWIADMKSDKANKMSVWQFKKAYGMNVLWNEGFAESSRAQKASDAIFEAKRKANKGPLGDARWADHPEAKKYVADRMAKGKSNPKAGLMNDDSESDESDSDNFWESDSDDSDGEDEDGEDEEDGEDGEDEDGEEDSDSEAESESESESEPESESDDDDDDVDGDGDDEGEGDDESDDGDDEAVLQKQMKECKARLAKIAAAKKRAK